MSVVSRQWADSMLNELRTDQHKIQVNKYHPHPPQKKVNLYFIPIVHVLPILPVEITTSRNKESNFSVALSNIASRYDGVGLTVGIDNLI